MSQFTKYEAAILAKLSDKFGTTTGDIAQQLASEFILGVGRRSHSAQVLRDLVSLEARGHVKRMDDKKPIAWVLG